MIRINLGRTRIEDAEGLESAYRDEALPSGQSPLVTIFVKILLIVGGTIALNFYEGSNIDELNKRVMQQNTQRSQLQAELDQKNSELQTLGTAQDDSKALQDKMKLLKNLSRLRLREVKSLDFIQSIVPARMWLIQMRIEKDNYLIKGLSRDNAAVSTFVNKLEDGGYFSDVVLTQDNEIQDGGYEMREFEIVARSEVVN